MALFSRICPYCKEKVKKDALVCRYCQRELEPESSGGSGTAWVFAGFLGLTLGAALALGLSYLDERRRWNEDDTSLHSEEEAGEKKPGTEE